MLSGLCPSQKEKGMPFGLYPCQRKKISFLEIAVTRRKRYIFQTMPLPRAESYLQFLDYAFALKKQVNVLVCIGKKSKLLNLPSQRDEKVHIVDYAVA
jgi:hypothetical protein